MTATPPVHAGRLVLHEHPFASYCQKVLIALDELGLPFTRQRVEGEEGRAALARIWPLAGIPVLQDTALGLTLPESTTIVEHLDGLVPGGPRLVPAGADAARDARLWDRIVDGHVATPMQRIVADALRPEGRGDPEGVAQARASLDAVYTLIDDRVAGRPWIAGDTFTLADCAAAPALFYARVVHRWDDAARPHLARYHHDLMTRPSVARVVDGGRPWRSIFPLPWPDDADTTAPGGAPS